MQRLLLVEMVGLALPIQLRAHQSREPVAAAQDVTLAAPLGLVGAAVVVLERQAPPRRAQARQILAVVAAHLAERRRLALAVPVS